MVECTIKGRNINPRYFLYSKCQIKGDLGLNMVKKYGKPIKVLYNLHSRYKRAYIGSIGRS